MERQQIVSLAEIFEVRQEGFTSEELLALLYSSADYLLSLHRKSLMSTDGEPIESCGLFTPDTLFIGRGGTVQILFVPFEHCPGAFIPPELRHHSDAQTVEVAAPQMVWCLGQIAAQASLPDADVALFSMLNLMTVEHVASRPSLTKLAQMIKNKMASVEGVKIELLRLYQELMGDINELIMEDGGGSTAGERRLSSARSSISAASGSLAAGNGTKEAKEAPPRLPERDFGGANEVKEVSIGATSPDRPMPNGYPPPPPNDHSNPFFDDDEEVVAEEELVVAEESVVTKEKGTNGAEEENNPFFSSGGEDEPDATLLKLSAPPKQPAFISTSPNIESVEVEVHTISGPPPLPPSPLPPLPLTPTTPTSAVSARHKPATTTTTARRISPPLPPSDEIEPFEPITLPPPPPPQPQPLAHSTTPTTPTNTNFNRQNSLKPSILKRAGSKRASVARRERERAPLPPSSHLTAVSTPEFMERSAHPMVRLRARSVKRKKVSLHRVEDVVVVVKLLNGHWLEVNCRSDAHTGSIFDTVAAHLNLTEHLFFGLAMSQSGEYFFLDNDQRLEKSAPMGWKSGAKGSEYSLHLRFRYYPKRLEFIRTETATHYLYLQLRQDVLEGHLRFSDRQKALELAAVALQAECANGGLPTLPDAEDEQTAPTYFKLENYLPSRFYPPSAGSSSAQLSALLARLHLHYTSMSRPEAERLFIERCQQEPAYGAHYYRLYKVKPNANSPYSGRDFDAHLIAIMPTGVGIVREQLRPAVAGGQSPAAAVASSRYWSSMHEWHMIRTLQFDRKRFLLATIENNIAMDHVFYARHYSMSGYLVRFAAQQHRFLIKMRQWQSTINRVRGREGAGLDVGVDYPTGAVAAVAVAVPLIIPEGEEGGEGRGGDNNEWKGKRRRQQRAHPFCCAPI